MCLKETIQEWVFRHPDAGKKLDDAVSGWLAKQPGLDHLEMPLACSACSHTWTKTFDLTKMRLGEAIREGLRCPICGSDRVRAKR